MDKSEGLALAISRASKVVFFTGAGISTESGLPDYRGGNGLWKTQDPNRFTLSNLLSSSEVRTELWKDPVLSGRGKHNPNAGHFAIAKLANPKREVVVITQNVDGLHQVAGSLTVIELHGSTNRIICRSCGREANLSKIHQEVDSGNFDPHCLCGGPFLPAVVFFEELVGPSVWNQAEAAIKSCEVFVVAGSSLVVSPAAKLPHLAVIAGARTAIINLGETSFDIMTDFLLPGPCGKILQQITARTIALDAGIK